MDSHQFLTDCQVRKLQVIPGKSIVPLLSASTSLIISWSSDSEGFWPSERMTVPSSFVVICPTTTASAAQHSELFGWHHVRNQVFSGACEVGSGGS